MTIKNKWQGNKICMRWLRVIKCKCKIKTTINKKTVNNN